MPKCTNCHGLKHGEKYSKCMECHSNPHAIKMEIKVTEAFAKECVNCHGSVQKEITQYKSKHVELGCISCHKEKHGYKPVCQECHSPHTEKQTYKDCLTCHKPHSPTNIPEFAKNTPNDVCGSCHTKPFESLANSNAKHKDLVCVYCHSKHKYIPNCRNCHGEPHSAGIHKKFPDCLKCHLDAHHLAKPTTTKK
jgi:predicted CXXCH cytochrome family protein